ncbi:MAG TPA: hypothetical protein H9984_12985 [Candidatus Parabacteroides faecavium]|nr:hypothetical protein [Candidatus Parabacteroides faecavium]
MNASQRQSILDAIVEFDNTDFNTPFQNKYKGSAAINNIVVAEYSIAEIFTLARKAVLQLRKFLENEDWRIIPSDNITLVLYGNISLRNTIVNITNFFKSASYQQAVGQIKALVYFEMQCGFWNQSDVIDLVRRDFSLEKLEQRAALTISHIDSRETKVQSLMEELKSQITEIENLIKTKREELETLKNNQSESNTILANIRNAQNNATTGQNTIETLNDKANAIVTALKMAQERINGQIKENDDAIARSEKALEEFNAEAAAKISQITTDYDSVSANAEEVRKMMGYIADGTLSHSFNNRKKDLSKRIKNWLIGCCVVAVLTVAWVCVVFFWLKADTGHEWANIIINGIKSSPLFFLLGFAITQYQKERNLMEEYAFRESVAATLTAYLERMPDKEDEDKRKLLMSTVEQLYTKPVIANKEYEVLKLDSKDISETTKILKDLIEKLLKNK